MKPKATVLVVLVSALPFGLFLAACEGLQTEHRIKVENLTGIWHKVDDGQYLQLNEDETYRVSSYIAGLEEYPSEVGRFQLEETSLTLITSDESPMCRGQQGIYQVELTEKGDLQFEPQEDSCQMRISFQPEVYGQVES